jgi:hypothetical protein
MKSLEKQGEDARRRQGNPALEILTAWCAMHQGRHDKVEFMLCPFCSNKVSPIWNLLLTPFNYLGQVLQSPTESVVVALPEPERSVLVQLLWARCPEETCHQILITVKRKIFDHAIPVEEKAWLAVLCRA